MADMRVQLEAEDWVRQVWMPASFGQSFRRERLRLSSGGVFDFDAVSADNTMAATISTSGASTARGKNAAAKLQKIRADMLFLLLTKDVQRRIVVLTEYDMYQRCVKEKQDGRAPANIEFCHAELPAELVTRLQESRKNASEEVTRSDRQ